MQLHQDRTGLVNLLQKNLPTTQPVWNLCILSTQVRLSIHESYINLKSKNEQANLKKSTAPNLKKSTQRNPFSLPNRIYETKCMAREETCVWKLSRNHTKQQHNCKTNTRGYSKYQQAEPTQADYVSNTIHETKRMA